MEPKEFGAFIQQRRKELDMTQNDLAEKLNVTAKAVSRWERGVGFPDIQLLEPLAQSLELTLIELMQSQKMEEPVLVEQVSDTVTAIQEQEERSRKQKTEYIKGLLIIGGSASFLYCLGQFYAFETRWIGGLLRFIALVGGVWGWRAYRSIVSGAYLKEQEEGIWYTWKPWAACGVSATGLALVTFLKDFVPKESAWYGALVILGMILLLPGCYYLNRYLFHGEEE